MEYQRISTDWAIFDFFEAEEIGGEGAVDEGVGLATPTLVGAIHFFVAYLFEDIVNGLDFVGGYYFYEFAVDTFVGIVGLFEPYLVAFCVGEYCEAVFGIRFGEFVKLAGLRHAFCWDVVDQEIGDV